MPEMYGHFADPCRFDPEIALPEIWGVAGREVNVYFDGVVSGRYSLVDFDVICAAGVQQSDRWTWASPVAGSQALSLAIHHPWDQEVIAKASSTVTIADAAATVDARVLMVGDSTTAAGILTAEMLAIAAADENAALSLYGTAGTGQNKHEGRSGWKAIDFVRSGSPFWINGGLDIGAYCTQNAFLDLTHVVLHLGINDMFSPTTDSVAQTRVEGYMDAISQLSSQFTAAVPGIRVGLALTIPPSQSQDSFGVSYAALQNRSRYRRNWWLLVSQVLRWIHDALPGVDVLPYSCSLDTARNMPVTTTAANARNSSMVVRQSNGVHPANSGYEQLADATWAWLKCRP